MTQRKANFIQIRQPHPPSVRPSVSGLASFGFQSRAAAWLRFRRDTLQIKSLLEVNISHARLRPEETIHFRALRA